MKNFNYKVLVLILTGTAALALAIGIGRFTYTPILPFMLEELNITKTEGGLIASWNFFGYLCGSLLSISSIFKKRVKLVFFISIVLSISTTFLMSINDEVIFFIIIRFISGLSSAFVLIFGTALILPSIQAFGKKSLSTSHFMGVGFGIVISSILVTFLGELGFHWDDLWIGVAVLSVILAVPIFICTPNEILQYSYSQNSNYKNNFSFSLISISYGLYGFGYVILGTFISAMARETSGLEATEMYVWLLVGLAGIPMVIFWPWFGKKIGNDLALFFACAIMGLGVLMPVLLENKVGITSASILLGSTFIPITALALLEGQSRHNGSIRVSAAILTSSFSVGQMIGPYFGGVIIDLFNSYSIALTISSISLFIASILMINPTRLINRKFRNIL